MFSSHTTSIFLYFLIKEDRISNFFGYTTRSRRISSFDLCSGVQCKKSTFAWPGVVIKNIIYVVSLMASYALRSWVLRWGVGSPALQIPHHHHHRFSQLNRWTQKPGTKRIDRKRA